MEIWKFAVDADDFKLNLPKGAKPLSVQLQIDEPQMWVLVNPGADREVRSFVTIGTGHPIEPGAALQFIDTFQMANGLLVFHVFERIGG